MIQNQKPAAERSGHREYTPGCDWCEATEDALDLLSHREIGTGQAVGRGLRHVRNMILSVTQVCGNPAVKRIAAMLLLALALGASSSSAQDGPAPGPWRLVAAGPEYSNFAWRINTETGEVHGLRFQHSDETGWSLELVDLKCVDTVRDQMIRSETPLNAERLAEWMKACRELEAVSR